jgi:hypothetical protein
MPRKDEDLPTNVIVTFRDEELSIPVTAAWADKLSTPAPTPTPTPTPPPSTLVLNSDVKLESKNGTAFITYREETDWTNFALQHLPEGAGEWRNYQLPAPHEGLLGWIKGLARRFQEFLETPIKRSEVDGLEPEERFGRQEIAVEEIDGPGVWRLVASRKGESVQRPVSEDFQIKSGKLVKAAPSRPLPPNTPQPTPGPQSPPPQTLERRSIGPVTEIVSAGTRPERNAAVVQVAFDNSLGIQGFRLERGAMVAQIDQKTGIPQTPLFEKIDPPGAEVELLGLAEGEADGKKFTICAARIGELEAGSRTYWRIVPEGPKGTLPPTTVMLVDTLPRPPFPWNTVLLGALILLLAGVLYLRWKINRPPA